MDQTLLMKYFRGETSPEEEHRILSWVEASPENRAEFRKAHLLFDGLVLYGPKPEDMQSNADKKHWEGWRFARHTVRIAAAIVGIVGAAYFGKVYYHRLLSKQQTLISVPAGQRMQMTLADGTLVHLNAGTTLEYPVVFSRKDRRVKLTGEALFEVAHNAKHPFIVETFATDLQVLGTKFNVLADPNNEVFSTTLIEGKVKVTNRNDPAESIIMQPNDMVVLENGRLYKERVSDFDDLAYNPFALLTEADLTETSEGVYSIASEKLADFGYPLCPYLLENVSSITLERTDDVIALELISAYSDSGEIYNMNLSYELKISETTDLAVPTP